MTRRSPFMALLLVASIAVPSIADSAPRSAQRAAFADQLASLRTAIITDPGGSLVAAGRLRSEAGRLPPGEARITAQSSVDHLRAEALIRTNRPRDALSLTEAALATIAGSEHADQVRANLLRAHGAAAAMIGRIGRSLEDYQQAYRAFGIAGDVRSQAMTLQDIGSIYRDAGDYENALKYNEQSIESDDGDPRLLVAAYNNRGNALTELHRFAGAETEFQRALPLARQLRSPLLEARILENLATAQLLANHLDLADATLVTGFKLAETGPAISRRPILAGIAAQVALRRGRLAQAASLIQRTFAGVDLATTTMPMRDLHRTAYAIFRARGETGQALAHLEAYKRLDDEARALAASSNAALMGARFDFTNQDLKIAKLRAGQADRDTAIARAQARFRAGLLVAAAVISTLLLIGFISIRRSRNAVRAANATLSGTNAALEKALAAKTEFLATTSHEIRTPLNGILGMTQVILADRALAAPLRTRIELVHGAGETMRALVDDILDVAKIETGELVIRPQEMDLVRLLGDAGRVWADTAEAKGVSLLLQVEAAPAAIVADEVRLRQIVFNLMSNAVKFTSRGEIRLSVETVATADGERLAIRIEDSGIGIPADQLETIFESFRQVDGGTTRQHGGTGLGLAICRSLARAMGGDVTVTSTPGIGSVFLIDLPLERAFKAAAPDRAHARATRLDEAELLVIEANPLGQSILRAVLGGSVAGLHIAGGLDEALARLAAGGLDHVLADGGTLGLDVAAVAQLATSTAMADARLSLLWPAPDAAVAADLHAANVGHLIAKPIVAPDLLAALQRVYDTPMADRDIAA